RNDFVRKREFDMLRKIRREGFPADGSAGLQGSDLDDSDQRIGGVERPADAAVKAKIDEIEQQMEGESIGRRTQPSHPPSFYTARTVAGSLDPNAAAAAAMERPFTEEAAPPPQAAPAPVRPPAEAPAAAEARRSTRPGLLWDAPSAPAPLQAATAATAQAATAKPMVKAGHSDFNNPFAVEVNEIAHDPVLDEAVISFANAEFESCERSISDLISPQGDRANHAETWLVLFDLYRATGQQQPFENLALDYVQRFGWSPPQWFSIPQLVAQEASLQAATKAPSALRSDGAIGWVAPGQLDIDGVMTLRAKTLQMPLPWVLDWGSLKVIDPEASSQLSQLLRHWATQKLEMRWIGFEQLMAVLAEAAPTGVRDADPVHWLLRLEALRLANRADQFDEVAIDYCVTYEVSPPSWEKTLCTVKLADAGGQTLSSRSMVTDVSTGFAESQMIEEAGGMRTAAVDLSGQLVGDIGKVLTQLEAKLGSAGVVSVNCARLIRMDFVAAGDLLNWVLQRRTEQRLVHFEDAHRLVGLFFNAMGINEHARVKVRNI
ncbi:MAG TPA: hypothetical protein VLI72_13985, partial [Methylibium sp.]|nr:hypothetical protein [Methylibium sp.]